MAETIQDLSKELQSTRRFLAHMNTLVDGIIRSRKLIGRDEAQELRVNNSLEEALASTKTIRGKVEAMNIQPLSDAELDELAKQTSMTREGVRPYTSPMHELNICDEIGRMVAEIRKKLVSKE